MPANDPITKFFSRGRDGGPNPSRQRALLFAAIAAIVAFILIFLFVHHYDKSHKSSSTSSKVTVYVATTDIPAQTPFAQYFSSLKGEVVPASAANSQAVTSEADLVNTYTTTKIAVGQQVLLSDVKGQSSTSNAFTLSGNERAITLSLDVQHGQTAVLNANNRVDIIDYVSKAEKSVLIATNVLVLKNLNGEVSLEVSQKQSLLITAAQSDGDVWLSVRGTPSTDQIHVGDFVQAPK